MRKDEGRVLEREEVSGGGEPICSVCSPNSLTFPGFLPSESGLLWEIGFISGQQRGDEMDSM